MSVNNIRTVTDNIENMSDNIVLIYDSMLERFDAHKFILDDVDVKTIDSIKKQIRINVNYMNDIEIYNLLIDQFFTIDVSRLSIPLLNSLYKIFPKIMIKIFTNNYSIIYKHILRIRHPLFHDAVAAFPSTLVECIRLYFETNDNSDKLYSSNIGFGMFNNIITTNTLDTFMNYSKMDFSQYRLTPIKSITISLLDKDIEEILNYIEQTDYNKYIDMNSSTNLSSIIYKLGRMNSPRAIEKWNRIEFGPVINRYMTDDLLFVKCVKLLEVKKLSRILLHNICILLAKRYHDNNKSYKRNIVKDNDESSISDSSELKSRVDRLLLMAAMFYPILDCFLVNNTKINNSEISKVDNEAFKSSLNNNLSRDIINLDFPTYSIEQLSKMYKLPRVDIPVIKIESDDIPIEDLLKYSVIEKYNVSIQPSIIKHNSIWLVKHFTKRNYNFIGNDGLRYVDKFRIDVNLWVQLLNGYYFLPGNMIHLNLQDAINYYKDCLSPSAIHGIISLILFNTNDYNDYINILRDNKDVTIDVISRSNIIQPQDKRNIVSQLSI